MLDLVVPIYEDNAIVGTLRATFSLATILMENVPWWIAEQYHVSLIDQGDVNVLVLAHRSEIG
ncbi:C4-dicarboxylate transport sensor histidine kinase, partial [Alcaligenes faecalis subsp. faecalis NCIB 8687]